MPQTYTVKQVADILGYSTNSIYTFLKEKRIKSVRVGKGRFRVPQIELDRLLAVVPAKKPDDLIAPTAEFTPAFKRAQVIASHEDSDVHVPNFFDWYLGSVSALTAATLLLFSPLLEEIKVSPYLVFRPFLAMTLVVGAIGLLYADTVAYQFRRWRGIFYALILLGLTAVGGLFYVNGDYPWVGIMSSIILMGLLRVLAHIDGVKAFVWHVGELWAIFCLSLILWPTDERIRLVLQIIPVSLGVMIGAAITITFLFIVGALWGQREGRRIFAGLLVGMGVFFVAIALVLGIYVYWLRAFVFLTIGFFAFFVPVWDSLILTRRDHQRIVFQLVGCMLGLSFLAIVLLRLFQDNSLSYMQVDLKQKAHLSALTIASAVDKTQQTLVVFAQNPLVGAAVKEEKISDLQALSRSVFESHAAIRRIIITRADGDILSDYPLVNPTLTTSTLANRDYFIQAVTGKRPIISDVVNSLTMPSRASVAIAVPMVNITKDVVGAVVGVLDMDAINLDVQQLITTDRGEYVVVVDKAKKRIMHPDITFVGGEVRANDSVLGALTGQSGVVDDYSYEDMMAMVAYTPIPDLQWGLSVKVEKQRVLENTGVSVVAVLALTSVWVIMLGMILARHGRKSPIEEMDTS